jgi:molecular chaperone GrpE
VTDNPRETGPVEDTGPVREQVVIRDKRKIDAEGQPKAPASHAAAAPAGADANGESPATMGQPAAAGAHARAGTDKADGAGVEQIKSEETEGDSKAAPLGAELESLRSELDERLRDLQRITAEYANYRKRVERDRGVVAEQAVGAVVGTLLPILDDLDRARDHGDLVGPFGAMAEQLSAALAKFGLTGFGEQGDAFDPTRHEAVAHQTSAEVTAPTCVGIMRRGYLLGDRLLRPALVSVADPE